MEAVGLYLMLKGREKELDSVLQGLLTRLETTLFEALSIEELENLDSLYSKKIDVLSQRGYF
jgi:hypothetical protein